MGREGGMRYKINILPCAHKTILGKGRYLELVTYRNGMAREKEDLQEVVSYI